MIDSTKVANAYQRTQVTNASPAQLVVLLYDGAVRSLEGAREMMRTGQIEARHKSILKAQRIVSELMATLNMEQGGEVAANLQRLYAYMLAKLVDANLKDSQTDLEEVIGHLTELRDSWRVIANTAEIEMRSAGNAA